MVNIIVDGVVLENFSPSVAKHFAELNDWIEIEDEDADDDEPMIDCDFLNNGDLCGDSSMDVIKCIGKECPYIQISS